MNAFFSASSDYDGCWTDSASLTDPAAAGLGPAAAGARCPGPGLGPGPELLLRTLVDVVDLLGWTSVVVVRDETAGEERGRGGV